MCQSTLEPYPNLTSPLLVYQPRYQGHCQINLYARFRPIVRFSSVDLILVV
ncbi:hypothetical protein J6590_076775 [Homalodisca vitripennis]|nr:hypothetical protein J6590_076775 [Homalodisca vitripennis]